MPPSSALSRRDLLQRGALGAVALAASGRAAAANPPNIVFILADDLGYADLSCYGRRDFTTPNIDGIAARGARLLQAYANSPVCSATRTALITGRYQFRLPVGLEEPIAGDRHVGLPPQHPTLPSILRKAGYGTTLIGKWHLGSLPDYGPLKSGYDHFYGFRGGAVDYFSHKSLNGKADLWDGDVVVEEAGYLTELLGNRAVAAIEANARVARPFFISLHFSAPHWPWEGPDDQAESERIATGGLFHFDGGSLKTYQAMVEALDRQVGRVLAALDANGLTGNTIVIFTSDNGGERFSDTWPFSGRKTELLEGGLRIPALVSWPAQIAPGGIIDQVAISMDWLPTLAAAAGTSADPLYPSDGINLLPELTGSRPAQPRKLFWRYKANAQRAVRDGDYKYLKIRDNTFLFNLAEDPLERANLRERHKDVHDRLASEWLAWNETMLPEIGESRSGAFTAKTLADRFGIDGEIPTDVGKVSAEAKTR